MVRNIPERTRILVGCEGESENGYTAFLNLLARDLRKHVHLNAIIMKGGDTLARLEWLAGHLERENNREPFAHKYALLDTDQDRLDLQRASKARKLADELGIVVIWQNPTHEGLLVRHFEGYSTRQPEEAADALQLLRQVWADYRKGSPARHYNKILTQAHLDRAAGVTPELRHLLVSAGLL